MVIWKHREIGRFCNHHVLFQCFCMGAHSVYMWSSWRPISSSGDEILNSTLVFKCWWFGVCWERERERVVKGSTEVMSILLFFWEGEMKQGLHHFILLPRRIIIQHTLPCKEGSHTILDPFAETDLLRFLHPWWWLRRIVHGHRTLYRLKFRRCDIVLFPN